MQISLEFFRAEKCLGSHVLVLLVVAMPVLMLDVDYQFQVANGMTFAEAGANVLQRGLRFLVTGTADQIQVCQNFDRVIGNNNFRIRLIVGLRRSPTRRFFR